MKYSNYMYCVFLMDDAYYTYMYLCAYYLRIFQKQFVKKQLRFKCCTNSHNGIFDEIKMLRVDVEATSKYKYLKICITRYVYRNSLASLLVGSASKKTITSFPFKFMRTKTSSPAIRQHFESRMNGFRAWVIGERH